MAKPMHTNITLTRPVWAWGSDQEKAEQTVREAFGRYAAGDIEPSTCEVRTVPGDTKATSWDVATEVQQDGTSVGNSVLLERVLLPVLRGMDYPTAERLALDQEASENRIKIDEKTDPDTIHPMALESWDYEDDEEFFSYGRDAGEGGARKCFALDSTAVEAWRAMDSDDEVRSGAVKSWLLGWSEGNEERVRADVRAAADAADPDFGNPPKAAFERALASRGLRVVQLDGAPAFEREPGQAVSLSSVIDSSVDRYVGLQRHYAAGATESAHHQGR